MKIALLGDFISDNGPGNANKQIKEALMSSSKFKIKCSKADNKIGRILETVNLVIWSDVLMICSRSQLNYFAIKIATIMNRKILYLAHGCVSYEMKINNPTISHDEILRAVSYEKYVYDKANRIVCVSKKAMKFMSLQFPEYADKFDYIYNIVNIDAITTCCNPSLEKEKKVLTVGGGLRRKNNYSVAKAMHLVEEKCGNVPFIVVGEKSLDGDKIEKFPEVQYIKHLPHEELIELMGQCSLYVQNSTFETFGLAIIEALAAGADVLMSANVGCIDLFNTIQDSDIIYDVNDIDEISKKIVWQLENGNNERLWNGMDKEMVSTKFLLVRFDAILMKLLVA